MKKVLFILATVSVIFACKEKHPVQPSETIFDNYPKVLRIESVGKDSIHLKNNTGKFDTISNNYLYRTSKFPKLIPVFPDSIVVKKKKESAYTLTIVQGEKFTFKSAVPINLNTDTVFLYKKDTMKTASPILVDKFLPQGNVLNN